MPFQTTIPKDMAAGVPGSHAALGPEVINTYIAHETITIGRAVWLKAAHDDLIVGTGSGAPLGIATRDHIGDIMDIKEAANMQCEAGDHVQVWLQGTLYAVLTNDATAGQAVFAKQTDGTLQAGSADTPPDGTAATKFTVARSGKAGEIVIITSW